MKNNSLPWFQCFLGALAIGALVGGSFAFFLFSSEQRDWGKVYDSYDKFVAVYLNLGVQWSLLLALLFWLVAMSTLWTIKRIKARRSSDQSDAE